MKKQIATIALAAALLTPAYALKSYHFGCSTTDQFLHGMAAVAQGFGDTQVIDKYTIAGAGMHVLWHNAEGRFEYSWLRDQSWDAIICAAFPNGWELGIEADVKYMSYFYDAAKQGNPNAILYTWSVYPGNDASSGTWEAQWNNPNGATSTGAGYSSKAYHEALFFAARQKYGAASVRMMPIGHAMNKLHERIKSGRTTRFTNIFQLYGDGIHLNEFGGYLGVMVHYAVLFGKNPRNAIRNARWGYWQVSTTIDEEFAGLAQDIAWETVTELSAYTGVPVGVGTKSNPASSSSVNPRSSSIGSDGTQRAWYTVDGRMQKASTRGTLPGIRIHKNGAVVTGFIHRAQ